MLNILKKDTEMANTKKKFFSPPKNQSKKVSDEKEEKFIAELKKESQP